MAVIVSTTDNLALFLNPDYHGVDVNTGAVNFYTTYFDDWTEQTQYLSVTYQGDFRTVGARITGVVTSITYHYEVEDWDGGTENRTVDEVITLGNGVSIRDLYALQSGGEDSIARLLSGSDELTGVSHGYAGNDRFHRADKSFIDGGSGFDTASFDLATRAIRLDLRTEGDQFASIERFLGSRFSDDLRGTSGNDDLRGVSGNDNLVGRTGNDTLYGGNGNDDLIGSTGRDLLVGGAGSDRFVYERVSDSTYSRTDTISDFQHRRDIIDLRAIDANELRSGNNTFRFIGDDGFHDRAGELRVATARSGEFTVIQGDVNGDGIADIVVRLTGAVTVTASDLLL